MYYAKILTEKTCPICGKLFIPAPEHAYSVGVRNRKTHYTKKVLVCSWGCLRAYEKGAKLNDCE